MRLWQRVGPNGKLHYSLIPSLEDVTKDEESCTILPSLPNIKTEATDEQSGVQKTTNYDINNYLGSMVHLCEVAIDYYICDRCGMKFPMESMLNRHKLSHNLRSWLRKKHLANKYVPGLRMKLRKRDKHGQLQKRPENPEYVCNLCDYNCKRRGTLTMHIRRKHKSGAVRTDSRKFSCVICGFECKNQVALNKHLWEHRNASTMQFTCERCSFECKRSTTLVSHIIQNHQKSESNADAYSKKKYSNRTSDKQSVEQTCLRDSKRETSTLSCTRTEFECKTESPTTTRVSKKQSKKTPEEHCNLCNFKCATKSTLYSHKRQHKVESISEVYACNECGFKTGKKSSLYSHIKRKHKAARSGTGESRPELYYCNQCDYKNKNKYELKVHVARKHTDDFKFSCETCGKKFKVKGDLTNHIRFSHREQPVICDVCGKTCLNSNSLYVHQKFAHYKAKYECQVCKRRMVTQENLNEHMLRQHERRENAVCEECGKTFSRNSRLKVHMRIHTGDKPYTCTICNKSFARRTALKQHLLIHTGMRPYVCDICGKAFTQKPGLISHRKSHPGSHPPLPRVLIDHILSDVMNN